MESLRGPYESVYPAIERANDMFLTDEERRRKENAEAFRKLGIPPPRAVGKKVVKLGE